MTALLYTLGAFALILVLSRLKVPLWAAILVGALAVGTAFRLPPAQIAGGTFDGLTKPMSIGLVVIIVSLLLLSETMRASGQLEDIVGLVKSVLGRPVLAMVALPALIGLLPMPGGAIFSAPMVESAAAGAQVDRARLSAINYWFRHVWEHWWPLYPGVILAITLTNSDLGVWFAYQVPLGIFMLIAGLPILRGIHPSLHQRGQAVPSGTWRRILGATSPIWMIILVWAAVRAAMALLPESWMRSDDPYLHQAFEEAPRLVPIMLGLLVSLAWTIRLNRLSWDQVRAILARGSTYGLAGLALTIMVFQAMLEKAQAAQQISVELNQLNVPVAAVVVILPFIAGMVTGVAFGFVGASFPIVLTLIEANPPARPFIVLAYASGHLGMMLSPLHLCQVVSNAYFKTSFGPVYRIIGGPGAIMAGLVAAYVLALWLAMR